MIDELIDLFDWMRAVIAGWRFMFSPGYRTQVVSGWIGKAWYHVAWDILCGLAGIVLSLFVLYLLWLLLKNL